MEKGIYPALITPFNRDGKIDFPALNEVVDQLIGRGVAGFYVCGSTAETMLLSLDERKKILESVVNRVSGRVDIVTHIGAQYTLDSIELARHAGSVGGVSAVSSLPPIYFKYTAEELAAYFREIADSSELPLIVYNAPALAGVEFKKENLGNIFSHPKIAGMKYTSYDLFGMQRVISAYPDKLIINGHDELFLNTLPFGLKYAIGSTFNFMPEKFTAIRDCYEKGDPAAAYAIQDEVNEIIEGLIKVGVFRGVKGMMKVLGLPVGDCRRPFSPLSGDELDFLSRLAEKCKRFN